MPATGQSRPARRDLAGPPACRVPRRAPAGETGAPAAGPADPGLGRRPLCRHRALADTRVRGCCRGTRRDLVRHQRGAPARDSRPAGRIVIDPPAGPVS